MVSIVIVSHSPDLAKGLLSLVNQMTQEKVQVTIAAGVDDPDNPIGTDAIAVMTAIEEVYSSDGVVVLVDMGSAILSTDMALELLGEEIASNVHVCAAPIVEGAISASVAAAAGMNLKDVVQEAHTAIAAKYQLLDQGNEILGRSNDTDQGKATKFASDGTVEFEWVVRNPHGIHARPASAIVTAVSVFAAEVWLSCDGKTGNARSINSIALLGIKEGAHITFHAQGEQAEEALQAFRDLAESHFNEQVDRTSTVNVAFNESTIKPASIQEDGLLQGVGASEGMAIAPVFFYQVTMPKPGRSGFLGYEQERELFERAQKNAQKELGELAEKTAKTTSPEDGEIFKAHSQMLADPDVDHKLDLLLKDHVNVEHAWYQVVDEIAGAYENSDSEYMQARSKDVYDLGYRVMRLLCGHERKEMAVEKPVILMARDLSPSDTALLNPKFIKGLILEQGGTTSHSAIIARALGIPAVVGVTCDNVTRFEGIIALIDGSTGTVQLSPSVEESQRAHLLIEEDIQQKELARQTMLQNATTRDGKRIEVFANIASVEDAVTAVENGAEGVGLVRSEFLFTQGEEAPVENMQYEMYSNIAKAFHGAPVIIRTLDIGGDKPLQFLQQKTEENPFLGCRGVRLCLQNIDVFATQLKALLRAHAEYPNIKIMFPMIATVEEVTEVKSLVDTCYEELREMGLAASIPELGIMIEVPAAVANAEQLAQHVSFFSIGTNDLTQYVMAADRGNDAVSYLISPLQPAVLRMINTTVKAAKKAQIPVGVCGEMAGDSHVTEILLGLGVNELSMSSTRIANVKQRVRDVDMGKVKDIVVSVLNAETLEQVQSAIS